jgi:uncharacterized protein YidB (DUF937 family)
MGLFDNIAGKVIGRLGADDNDNVLLQAAVRLFNEHGGLDGILNRFRAGGLGVEVDSWIGTGPNLPITPSQIVQVLGQSELDDIAARVNRPSSEVGSKLAEHLPRVIDRLTPDGTVPKNQTAALLQALSLFRS